ncbi:hypothetical protein DFJ73DRAFT_755631 [Zopfochytrium polystomum]|nr:hypothetical protein DFJ73DRAFT_755631 [Zopfochytrium polystomum]
MDDCRPPYLRTQRAIKRAWLEVPIQPLRDPPGGASQAAPCHANQAAAAVAAADREDAEWYDAPPGDEADPMEDEEVDIRYICESDDVADLFTEGIFDLHFATHDLERLRKAFPRWERVHAVKAPSLKPEHATMLKVDRTEKVTKRLPPGGSRSSPSTSSSIGPSLSTG